MRDTIYFAGGCFWCTEAAFQRVPGVEEVISGYSGGTHDTATYEEVSSGKTNHAETVAVTYESEQVSLEKLLKIFFTIHDPTTLNQQGADRGTQYRSAIFYTQPKQEIIIKNFIQFLSSNNVFKNPIVTVVEQLKSFYRAEEYHQNFYNRNPEYGYCQIVINPKLNKLTETLNSL